MNSNSKGQQTITESTKEGFSDNRKKKILEEIEEKEEEKMLRAIEREHLTRATKRESGEIDEKLIIEKVQYPTRYVELPAIEALKKLEVESKIPKIDIKPCGIGSEVSNSGYGTLVHLLPDIVSYRVPHFSYDEYLEAFTEELKRVGVIEDDAFGSKFQEYASTWIPPGHCHPIEDVLVSLKKGLNSKAFKSKLYTRRAKAKRIKNAFIKMFRRCLALRGRILIVRVDLIYLLKDELPGMHPLFSDHCPDQFAMEAFIRDRDRFINNVRERAKKGGPFEHLLEWGWKQECGEKRGWHLHCVFIFDASKVKKYWFYAMQLAELWERLTGGRGFGHICRKGDRSYKSNCLGEVRRGDAEAEQGFKYLARYLSLDDQMPVVLPSKKSQNYGITRIRAAERRKNAERKWRNAGPAEVNDKQDEWDEGDWRVGGSEGLNERLG